MVALLDVGASILAADRAGQTALHHAAYGGRVACLRALLAAGAGIEAADSEGITALHLAAVQGHAACLEAVRLLEEASKAYMPEAQGTLTAVNTATRHLIFK